MPPVYSSNGAFWQLCIELPLLHCKHNLNMNSIGAYLSTEQQQSRAERCPAALLPRRLLHNVYAVVWMYGNAQVGSSQGESLRDIISEAFMQAARAGILCVASAGNDGDTGTVTNSMPWAVTGEYAAAVLLGESAPVLWTPMHHAIRFENMAGSCAVDDNQRNSSVQLYCAAFIWSISLVTCAC